MLDKKTGRKPTLTIKDVAAEAHVSVGTVSAVLNARTNVAQATRDHVEAVMERLGYEPKSAARALRRNFVSSIGLIVPDLNNSFFSQVAQGVQRGIADHDILMTLCLSWAQSKREEYFAQLLRSQRLDGVIYLSGTGLPSASLVELTKTRSVVFVDEVLPGIDCPSVLSDNRRGAREVMRCVLEAGHSAIAVIEGPPRLWTSDQRLSGFREALYSGDKDPDQLDFVTGDYSEKSGYQAATALFAGDRDSWPTAVVCANDQMAIGVINFCREASISVPHSVSVTGFDDITEARLMHPALTTVAQPGFEMGRSAAHLLLHSIGVRTTAPDATHFDTSVRVRKSVAAAMR
ncbi:LacI family DNA-binding transcriptional regulator [Cohaesibacter celericrescens]|uniref:LacI family transcriptional regulator n=1 Tax=Cohaesibacter celericrescens TaxID=2067669 RepID=A0A2N5XNK1_9HYPH|nr:LacI family DNA-binding transcriptional regulator [Cohaesibacter celericrescens]PLW76055.1 LacI family transcriptional regulator [Cohaesibacter celericrescens]